MKKKFGLILTLIAFFLAGCNSGNSGSQSTSVNNSSVDNSVASASQNESKFEWNNLYSTTSWDEDLVDLIGVIVGDENKESVPAVTATRFDYYLTVDHNEESSVDINIAVINCYGINPNTIVDDYEFLLDLNGYQFYQDIPCAWIEASDTETLNIQYTVRTDKNNQSYFEIIVFKKKARDKKWPEKAIGLMTSEVVPAVDAVAYETYLDAINYEPYIGVLAYKPKMTLAEYESKLIDAGYTIGTSFDGKAEAVSKLGTHIVYYESNIDNGIVLRISNDWPYSDIIYYLGMDLPRLDDDNAQMSYMYVENGDYTNLAIYFDNTDSSSIETYGNQLTNIGFTQYGEEQTTKNEYTLTTREYIMNPDQEDEHYLALIYCLEQQSLAVIIYY